MNIVDEKLNTVPFDPGFAPYVLVFSTTYFYMEAEVRKFKNANQRKMKYKSLESGIMKLCDNLISFYFGGMLYGAYLKNKFKDEPKELAGNDFFGLNLEDCKNGDVSIEVQSLEKFIKNNDRNPFASKKINPKYTSIIDSYIEFLEKNEYFINVKTTNDIKIPSSLSFISKYKDDSLDEILATIDEAITSRKIEKLLSSKYFEKIKG